MTPNWKRKRLLQEACTILIMQHWLSLDRAGAEAYTRRLVETLVVRLNTSALTAWKLDLEAKADWAKTTTGATYIGWESCKQESDADLTRRNLL